MDNSGSCGRSQGKERRSSGPQLFKWTILQPIRGELASWCAQMMPIPFCSEMAPCGSLIPCAPLPGLKVTFKLSPSNAVGMCVIFFAAISEKTEKARYCPIASDCCPPADRTWEAIKRKYLIFSHLTSWNPLCCFQPPRLLDQPVSR